MRLAALLCAVAIAACGSRQRTAEAASAQAPVRVELADSTGTPRPVGGKGRVTVLCFFATWAKGAKVLLPQLDALSKKLGPEVEFYAVAMDEDLRFVSPYLSNAGVTIPVLLDKGAHQAEETFGVQLAPTVVVLDGSGVVRQFHSGMTSDLAAQVENEVKALAKVGGTS